MAGGFVVGNIDRWRWQYRMGKLSFNSKPNASTVPNLPEVVVWGELLVYATHNHFYFHSYSTFLIMLYD